MDWIFKKPKSVLMPARKPRTKNIWDRQWPEADGRRRDPFERNVRVQV